MADGSTPKNDKQQRLTKYEIPNGPAGPAPADSATLHVTLNCYDGDGRLTVPPEEVLQVCVVGPHAFLAYCNYSETSGKTATATHAECHVDAWALLRALADQLGIAHLIVGAGGSRV